MDARRRELEARSRRTKAPADAAALLVQRLRAGESSASAVALAAYCGDEAAMLVGDPPRVPSPDSIRGSIAVSYMGGLGFTARPGHQYLDPEAYGPGFVWCHGLRAFSTKATVRATIAAARLLNDALPRSHRALAAGIDAARAWVVRPSTSLKEAARCAADHLLEPARIIGPSELSRVERMVHTAGAACARCAANGAVGEKESEKARAGACNAAAQVFGLAWKLVAAVYAQPGAKELDPFVTTPASDARSTAELMEAVRREVVPWALGDGDPLLGDRPRKR